MQHWNACYRAVSKDQEYWRTYYVPMYYVLRGTPYPKLQKFIQKITKTIFVPGTIPFSVGVLLRLNLNYKGSDIDQVRPNFVQKSYKRYFHYG